MYKIEITIKDWLALYNQCVAIQDLKPQVNKDYIAFITKKANPVKVGQTKKFVKYIPKVLAYYKFFENNNLWYMIPLELPDETIIGFILKSYNKKEYRTVIFSEYSVFFGLYDFLDYQKNKLIILVEGSKDCLYLKQLYKYSLALNTSKLTSVLVTIIKCLTDKVLLIYDNDLTGSVQIESNKMELQKQNIKVFTIKYQLKDPGEYFNTSLYLQEQFKAEINKIISICNR